jgi:hypothetical protein
MQESGSQIPDNLRPETWFIGSGVLGLVCPGSLECPLCVPPPKFTFNDVSWSLEISCGESIYTIEIGKCYT